MRSSRWLDSERRCVARDQTGDYRRTERRTNYIFTDSGSSCLFQASVAVEEGEQQLKGEREINRLNRTNMQRQGKNFTCHIEAEGPLKCKIPSSIDRRSLQSRNRGAAIAVRWGGWRDNRGYTHNVIYVYVCFIHLDNSVHINILETAG